MPPRRYWDPDRDKLIARARLGDITLVVGAGVSRAFGIPDWEGLARRIWARAFEDRPSPWESPDEHSPLRLPQFLPIVFERAAEVLDAIDSTGFVSALRAAVYAEARPLPRAENAPGSHDSLVVLARVLAQEFQRGGERRIKRIVTFNVDSLLQTMTNRLIPGKPPRRPQAVRTISRSTQEPRPLGSIRRQQRVPGRQPIPMYHIHGNIPRSGRIHYARYYEHRLVFTDSEYWTSSSSVLSFPNRTMGAALSDGSCIFVGSSMTDINLLRWLALHNADYENDRREERLRPNPDARPRARHPKADRVIRESDARHFWVRPCSDDPTGFLSGFLGSRGVVSVTIDDWDGPGLSELLAECFPV